MSVFAELVIESPAVTQPGTKYASLFISGNLPCLVCKQPLFGKLPLNRKKFKCQSCGMSYDVDIIKEGDLVTELHLKFKEWQDTLSNSFREFKAELREKSITKKDIKRILEK